MPDGTSPAPRRAIECSKEEYEAFIDAGGGYANLLSTVAYVEPHRLEITWNRFVMDAVDPGGFVARETRVCCVQAEHGAAVEHRVYEIAATTTIAGSPLRLTLSRLARCLSTRHATQRANELANKAADESYAAMRSRANETMRKSHDAVQKLAERCVDAAESRELDALRALFEELCAGLGIDADAPADDVEGRLRESLRLVTDRKVG